jgi:V/A-type H+-transporting ATPase subunit E
VGYQELLRALEEEMRGEARALGEHARAERDRILKEARRAASTSREEALARLDAELAAERARAGTRAALEVEWTLLAEKRRLLEALRQEILARLPARVGPEATARLLAEVLADDPGGALDLEVDPGHEEAVRALLARDHPGPAARATVRAAAAARGGVVVRAELMTLDNSLPARVEKAWPDLEGQAAALLFGGGDGPL